jgi:hypothetical protein
MSGSRRRRRTKEFNIHVPKDDFMYNFPKSNQKIQYFISKIVNRIGSIHFRITIDTIMFKETDNRLINAGFRSTLTPANAFDDITDLIRRQFILIDNNIENFNRDGMSGCVLKEIKNVRLMIMKQW